MKKIDIISEIEDIYDIVYKRINSQHKKETVESEDHHLQRLEFMFLKLLKEV